MLSTAELAILSALFDCRGVPMSREALAARAQACGHPIAAPMVDVHVLRLRRKLGERGLGRLIGTEWGRGYLIAAECDDGSATPIAAQPLPEPACA